MESVSSFFSHLKTYATTLIQSSDANLTPGYSNDATALAKLEENIKLGSTSYTNAITAAYNFNQKNRGTLVTITSQLARDRFLEKDSTKKAQLSTTFLQPPILSPTGS